MLVVALLIVHGRIADHAVALPLIVLPYVLLILGVTWILAALGVYLRDIAQITGLVTMLLMFLSPVLYPANALPQPYRTWLWFNPLTLPLEETRGVLIAGRWPEWGALAALHASCALAIACAGYWWFQKTRKGFADVV